MSKSKRPTLSASLIATKGAAKPAEVPPPPSRAEKPARSAPRRSPAPVAPPGAPASLDSKRVPLTVHLDQLRWKRASLHCIEAGWKLQRLFVEAIDAYLAAWPNVPAPSSDRPVGRQGTKALTVRLDSGRYRRLAVFAVDERTTHQAVCVDALDAYLAQHAGMAE